METDMAAHGTPSHHRRPSISELPGIPQHSTTSASPCYTTAPSPASPRRSRARPPEHAMADRPSSMATVDPPPHASPARAECVNTLTTSHRARCTSSLSPTVAGAPCRRRRPEHGRRRTWLGHLEPPRAEPWPPTGARRPPLAPPPFPGYRRGLLRPEQRAPTSSSVRRGMKTGAPPLCLSLCVVD
jgi:hypothetical protein